MQDVITAKQLKKKYPSMFKLSIPSRGNGKTILTTQRSMGVWYTKEFYKRIKSGEKLSEQDYVEGLKDVYVSVGKYFCGGDDDE